MIELNQTLSPPVLPEHPAPMPGMLAAKEYLTVRNNMLAEGNDRPGFLQEVKDAFDIERGQARCHYISYKVICLSIVNIINAGLSDTAAFQLLRNLYGGVYAFMPKKQSAAELAMQNISNIISQGQQNADAYSLKQEAISLLINLNSSIGNLRPGNQTWNASIQYQYDPSHWMYAVTSHSYRDETGGAPKDIARELIPGHFYLNCQDAFRLHFLEPLADLLPTIGVYTAEDQYKNRFMFSSNNKFALPAQWTEYSSEVHFEDWV